MSNSTLADADSPMAHTIRWLDLALALTESLRLLILGPLLVALTVLGMTYLLSPIYTARTSFIPPQQQQGLAAGALASLGALSGLAGASTGLRLPSDQYLALLQSDALTDRLIDEFKLLEVYKEKYRIEARRELSKNVRLSVGKRDGLITVEVDDLNPQRAADMANRHVEELRRLTSRLALTEAQQRRAFFEAQIATSRERLLEAQQSLQSSGFSSGALRAEPKAAVEGYARLKAEATAAEVRLQALRSNLADRTPEVQQQLSMLTALRSQLSKLEQSAENTKAPDYVGRYREFKYQETLFEMLARQFELARLDEAREGALIQVVDTAKVPEKKSWPKRGLITGAAAAVAWLLLTLFVIRRHHWRESADDPAVAIQLLRLRAALRRE